MIDIRIRRGAELPRHVHHWEDVAVYVLEGEVTFFLDGERHPRGAGECFLLPAGREHSYAIRSPETRWLVTVAPAGLEGFFAELNDLAPLETLPTEQLVSVAARYGVEITGPPATTCPGP